jgi:nitrogen fixation protein NifB
MTNQSDINIYQHPCFNAGVKGQFGRVHLPVAPQCNIKCNYCNRKYDCVNESRPGVSSTLLAPHQALVYMEKVLAAEPRIRVAGIAGPGDPFANAEQTMETLHLLRKTFPQLILCLASNGLDLAPHMPELAALGVSHVTVTVNGVDPEITSRIYAWVRSGKFVYRGKAAAELLLARQLEAVRQLKAHGITVKVNTIVIPGINDGHVAEVARTMAALGVDLLNCMAMFPNVDTPFATILEPPPEQMAALRQSAEQFLPQMRHCTRCRADAVGLLEADRTEEFRGCLTTCASLPSARDEKRPYVAVATREGMLVNQHLGEAAMLQIWKEEGEDFALVEERSAPPAGDGEQRWLNLARLLADCRAVLISGIGEVPRQLLSEAGIRPVKMNGFIDLGLTAVFRNQNPALLKARREPCTSGDCQGAGGGCN